MVNKEVQIKLPEPSKNALVSHYAAHFEVRLLPNGHTGFRYRKGTAKQK